MCDSPEQNRVTIRELAEVIGNFVALEPGASLPRCIIKDWKLPRMKH